MERSRKVLLKIASRANKVVAAANDYADRKDSLDVQRSHFQLEEEMQKVSVACECLAGLIGRQALQDGPAVDDRLKDWLGSNEPQMCFDTLDQMVNLLFREETFSWMSVANLGSRCTVATKDKIEEAVNLLESRKGYFHFLFSINIWNNENGVPQQQVVPESLEPIIQIGSNILEESLPLPVRTNISTTVPDTGTRMDGHGVTQTHVKVVNTQQKRELYAERLEGVLAWLDGLNCAEKQDVTLSLRQPDTCKWLFDTTQYRVWRDGNSSFLWLQGKPGAGKSVLASSVIDSLEKSPYREIFAFFYCDFRNERSTSASEAMRSILSQLLRQSNASVVDPGSLINDLAKAKERGGATRINIKELGGYASRAASLFSQNPLVVVDALDECKDVENLLEGLVAWTLKGNARLFVTSRPLQVIKDGLFGLPFLSMDDMGEELSADIELHVIRELDARRRLRQLDVDFKNKIRSVVCSKADGMFRWVQCSIETLSRCVTRREVHMALDALPDGLDETYEKILLAIDTRAREGQLAQRALIWLVAALRPLRLDELLGALSIDLPTRTLNFDFGPMHRGALLDACGSLVAYDERTGVIILSHFSVKEYLTGKLILVKLPQYHVQLERAHLHLAQSCMCYLSICLTFADGSGGSCITPAYASSGSQVSPNRRDYLCPLSHPLRDYVLNNALCHVQCLGEQFGSILHDIKVFEKDIQRHPGRWDNICLSAKEDPFSTTPSWPTSVHDINLYLLVAFAPDSLLRVFLRRAALRPKEGTNPLVYAANFNKYEHARTLLSQGAKLNCKGWETDLYHKVLPIEVALDYHYFAIVTLFVTEGSIVPPHIFIAPLFFDLVGVMMPYSVMKTLMQTDDFVEAANDPANQPAMQLANIFNSLPWRQDADEQDLIAIIRRFSQVIDNKFVCKSDGEASLCSVIKGGYAFTARYLLTLGVPLPPDILLSLHRFSRRRKAPMIQLLVEYGANVLVYTGDEDSVLHIVLGAINAGDDDDTLQSTRLLVAHGCNPLKPNLFGQTPLQVAVERGLVSVAHYLLSTFHVGIPHFPDLQLNTLLHHESQSFEDHGVLGVTKLLVGHGCDPLKPDLGGRTPLHIAVEHGLVSVVRYFLSRIQVGTPLPPDLVLLVTRRLSRYRVWHRWGKRLSMLRLLIENGANVLAPTTTGGSVLHDALVSFDDGDDALEATKLLVAHGCDPHEVDHYGESPARIAIRRMFVSVAQYLLSLGVSLPPDPLPVAFQNRGEYWKRLQMGKTAFAMVRLLIDRGADARARTWTGESILHTALKSFAEDDHTLEFTKLLVSRGCDPFETNYSGKTVVRVAVECGHVSAARYLLSLGASLGPLPDLLDMLSWCKKASMIWFLVENVIDTSTRTMDGDSVLHTVLRWEMMEENYALEATKVLVTRGCRPLEANTFGQTPLHIAFKRGYISVAQYLLSHVVPPFPDLLLVALQVSPTDGAKASIFRYMVERGLVGVNMRTLTGDSLLHIALKSFREECYTLEIAELLIHHGCDPLGANSNDETPIHIALQRRHVEVIRYLLSLGISPTPDLLLIVLGPEFFWPDKRASLVRCLVEHGADVHFRTLTGDSVLHIALQSFKFQREGALETTKLLVGHGCDPIGANSSGRTPLHIALEFKQVSVARYLLSHGVSPTPDLLLIALSPGSSSAGRRESFVRCLVDNGADIHIRNAVGDSVLHMALRSFAEEDYALETAEYLVDHGCDAKSANSDGQTPLHIAVERGHISVARYLLQTCRVSLSSNLLFVALNSKSATHQKTSVVRYLVEKGASVDVRTMAGDTVLHVALQSFNEEDDTLEVAKLLVDRGCDIECTNLNGQIPLHIAVERGHVSVVQYLQVCGVSTSPDVLSVALNPKLSDSEQHRASMVCKDSRRSHIARPLDENGINVDVTGESLDLLNPVLVDQRPEDVVTPMELVPSAKAPLRVYLLSNERS